MPARAVPDRDHPPRVDRQGGQQVEPGRHVLERRGPAAAGSHPPVLQVPGDVPAGDQVRGQRPAERQVEPGPPEAAVQDHHGAPGRAVGHSQLAELGRVTAVTVHCGLGHGTSAFRI